MKKALFIVLLLVAVSDAGSVAYAEDEHSVHREEYFEFGLPAGFVVNVETPVEDFDIYTVSNGSKPYLYIYVGNHSSFPKRETSEGNEVTELRADDFVMISEWEGEKLVGKEFLLSRKYARPKTEEEWVAHKSVWPTDIHVWTAPLGGEETIVADKMLSSFHVLPARPGKGEP